MTGAPWHLRGDDYVCVRVLLREERAHAASKGRSCPINHPPGMPSSSRASLPIYMYIHNI